MATPRHSEFQFAKLVGLDHARRQARQLPDVARMAYIDATQLSAAAIVGRARAAAPVRREGLPEGYGGGALKQHIAWEQRKPNEPYVVIGVQKIAIVARTRGRRGASVTVFHDHKFKRSRDGKWRRREISRRAMDRLRAGGAAVIRPAKYAPSVEGGHAKGKGKGAAAPRPFMGPAVRAEQANFEARCRKAQAEVERLLAEAGYRG